MAVSVVPALEVPWLGTLGYEEAWELQRAAVDEVRQGAAERMLLLEHPHVYTSGRRGRPEHLLVGDAELERLGAHHVSVDRGGDITYHGPGQLVGYPVIRLLRLRDDVVDYVRRLEAGLIDALAEFGIRGERIGGCTGVWVAREKIAAIGVKVSAGVTSHGFALNVTPDLSYFGHIVPCGITDKGVTSMARVLGREVTVAEVREPVARAVAAALGMRAAG